MSDQNGAAPEVASAYAQRRQITAMFCDLAGSTQLASQLDTEKLRELMLAYNSEIRRTAEEFGGTIACGLGDGALIYFGYPVASEADIEHAITAGLALVNRVHELRPDRDLKLRVGIATGEVIIGDDTGLGSAGQASAVGGALYLADRLQKLAKPNTVVICATTRERAGSLFHVAPIGPVKLKGLPEVNAWSVIAEAAEKDRFQALRLSRGLSPFVGRDVELECLERYAQERDLRILCVDVSGEPGIGKSRLLHEFKCAVEARQALILSGHCSPDGQQTALLPFIEILRASFDVSIGEGDERVRQKLGTGLDCLGLNSALNLGLLSNLVGLPPPPGALDGLDQALTGIRTRDLFLRLLRARAQVSRLILTLEDLHWIDSASEDLLHQIMMDPEQQLLVITTRRPECRPPWLSRDNVIPMPLSPLPTSQTKRIIISCLDGTRTSESFASIVAEKADGNPLLAEEMARFVSERESPPAGWDVNRGAEIPHTIQSLFTSRIDQLPPGLRSLLEAAAVVGRQFDWDLISRITGVRESDQQLTQLAELGILRPVQNQFEFKHVLLRDVLYNSMLASRRRSLHALVARTTEQRSADRLEEVAELLAYHYSETDEAGKAVNFLIMSGRKSFRVYSVDDAIRYFERALKLVEQVPSSIDPQRMGELIGVYIQVLALQAKYSQATAVFEKYRAELERLQDKTCVVLALNSTCFAYYMQLQLMNARAMAARALEISDSISDDRTRAYAVAALVFSQPATRMLPEDKFEALAADAVERSRRGDDGFIQVRLLFDLAWYHLSRGSFVEGRKCAVELMQVGRARNDPRAIGLANWTFGLHYVCEGSYEEALTHSQNALAASLTNWDREGALWVKAGALALSRRVDDARQALDEMSRLCTDSNDQVSLTSGHLFEGVMLIMKGQFARGIRRVEKCVEGAEAAGWASLADWARTNLAEVYLEFLTPSQKIGFATVIRNLPFLITVRIAGARRAAALLNRALENDWFSRSGYFRARMHFDLGRVQKIRRKRNLARRHWEQARKIASALGNARMIRDVESELRSLT